MIGLTSPDDDAEQARGVVEAEQQRDDRDDADIAAGALGGDEIHGGGCSSDRAAATSARLCAAGRRADRDARHEPSWTKHDMEFLGGRRLRRTRQFAWSRALVRETVLTPADLILPLFVIEGQNERTAIATMPGVERLSVDLAVATAKEARGGGHSGAGAVSQHRRRRSAARAPRRRGTRTTWSAGRCARSRPRCRRSG